MSADPSLFVFGHFADPNHMAEQARRNLDGLYHGARIEPVDPASGDAVRLFFSSAVDAAIDNVTVCEPGSSPTGLRWGPIAEAEHVGVSWDELAWRYVDHWMAELSPAGSGARIRYVALGRSTLRDTEVFADTSPDSDPTVFGFDVDALTAPEWIRDAVVYQIFVDRFFNPDGTWGRPTRELEEVYGGTLEGVTSRLDYLADLGINVVWLTPVFESETYHGYDALDFGQVAARLGGEDALRELVDKAHSQGINVLLDLAANHCSWHSPFFVDACTRPQSPYRDWFEFSDWPTQYRSFFGIPELPYLNGDNPEVVEYMVRTASRYLTEFGVDGFRLDHVLGPSFLFWTQFYSGTKAASPDGVTIGEATVGPGELRKYQGRMDGCLDFPALQVFRQFFVLETLDAPAFHALLTAHERFFGANFVLPTFLDNHDMNRFLWAAGGDVSKLKLAALCQMTLPQPPIVYYGTEIGLSQTADTSEIGFAASRLPMRWSDDIDGDLLEFYRTIIHTRHARPSLRRGGREPLVVQGRVYAYSCEYDGESTVVVLNAGAEPINLSHPRLSGHEVLSGASVRGEIALGPYSGALIVL